MVAGALLSVATGLLGLFLIHSSFIAYGGCSIRSEVNNIVFVYPQKNDSNLICWDGYRGVGHQKVEAKWLPCGSPSATSPMAWGKLPVPSLGIF